MFVGVFAYMAAATKPLVVVPFHSAACVLVAFGHSAFGQQETQPGPVHVAAGSAEAVVFAVEEMMGEHSADCCNPFAVGFH